MKNLQSLVCLCRSPCPAVRTRSPGDLLSLPGEEPSVHPEILILIIIIVIIIIVIIYFIIDINIIIISIITTIYYYY